MNSTRCRLIHFAGSTIALECDGDITNRIADFLIPPSALVKDQTPHITLRMTLDEQNSHAAYLLYAGEKRLYRGGSSGNLAEQTLSQVCHQLATESRPGLLFHSAALCYHQRGVIIPGDCGAGKSTLTAWLITHLGLNYLSDELVYFPLGGNTFQAFTRPLHLKLPSRPVLKPFFDLETLNETQVISSSFSDMVAPGVFGAVDFQNGDFPPDIFFFPDYQPDADFDWKVLTPAETGFKLMQSLINARNLTQFGFNEVLRLAQQGRAYAFTYSHFEQIEPYIKKALDPQPDAQ
jgi:hypothetical protein